MKAEQNNPRGVLIIVENLPVPFDRRVWQEATSLREAGYGVSIISPIGKGYEKRYEECEGIAIYRHPLPIEGNGVAGYLLEYGSALWWQFLLSLRAFAEKGFDAIHACNPPDTIFLIGLFYKILFGKKFLFDHHDINPELYLAKFGRKNIFYRLMLLWERLSFMAADVSIATNESYKKIAIKRGRMKPGKVTVVRSGPCLERMRIVPSNPKWKKGKEFLVGYLGVMGQQEGIDHLLEVARILVYEKQRADIHFVLVGSGTELEAMKRLSNELGLAKHVTFTGRISDEPMLEILCTADICVNPDVFNEMNDKSTMNKIMEYMVLGKPIVQYDLTEGRYSAQEASLYARPNDKRDFAEKILTLLEDPYRRKMMGEYGRRRMIDKLQWKHEKPKLLKAYEALFSH
jgi:glycosyltransferase involved in cell wall biosynthesis